VRAPYRWGQPRPTHCVRGHELTPDNVRVGPNEDGRERRKCRTCARIARRAQWERQKQAQATP
jgi:hypothetical protein